MLCSFSSMFCVVTIVSRRLFCVLFCFRLRRMLFSSSLLVAEGGGTGKRELRRDARDRAKGQTKKGKGQKKKGKDGNKKSKGRNGNSEGQKQLSEGHN